VWSVIQQRREEFVMASVRNQDVIRQVIEEGFNKGNYDALDALFAPDYQEHQYGMSQTLDGFKQDIRYLRAAFPDLHLTIDDMVADGDKVWIRMTAHGTNQGPLLGPPTGKAMTITVFDTCRFEHGQIVEHWGVPDRFAQMAQLGLLPQPARQKS
jgi:predicted ester cyclase